MTGHRSILATALGIAATEAGYGTYFVSAADLVANLQSAHLEGTAAYKMRTYTGPSVLVIDELGYLPLDQISANWIFQVVSRRYERGSVFRDHLQEPHSIAAAVFTDRQVASTRRGRKVACS